jgi:hypothetical protein
MPLGKPYDNKYMTEASKAGDMNAFPDGQLYRQPLEKEIIDAATEFKSTTDAASPSGSIQNQEKAIFAMADDNRLYDESGK